MAEEHHVSSRQIGRLLAELQRDFLVVTTPDHPFLLRGPDALVSSPGSLVLVFLPSEHERAQPATILSRLALSRYAYPSKARCVILVDQDQRISAAEVTRHFHEVIRAHDVHSIGQFTRSREANPNHVRSIPLDLRDDFTARFLSAEQITRENFDRLKNPTHREQFHTVDEAAGRKRGGIPLMLEPWVPSMRRSRSFTIFEDPSTQSLFASFPSSQNARLKVRVNRVIEHGVRGRFVLEDGVPYPRQFKSPMLLTLGSYRELTWDPLKVLRATAFGGWALVPDDSDYEFELESSRYRELEAANQQRLRTAPQEDLKESEE